MSSQRKDELIKEKDWGTEDEDLVLGLWGWNGAEHVAGCSGGERHSVMWSGAWDAGDRQSRWRALEQENINILLMKCKVCFD